MRLTVRRWRSIQASCSLWGEISALPVVTRGKARTGAADPVFPNHQLFFFPQSCFVGLMAAKDARIVIRLDQALLDWIREEAEKRGLDAAAFVRSQMAQMRSGLIIAKAAESAERFHEEVQEITKELRNYQEPLQADLVYEAAPDPADKEIDLDAILEQESTEFAVARPGDTEAVRRVGGYASRQELLPTFRRR